MQPSHVTHHHINLEDLYKLKTTWTPLQRNLSRLQIVPVIGPSVISPYKMLVSVSEITSGIAKGAFAPGVSTVMPNTGHKMENISQQEITEGTYALFYAIFNTATMGAASWVVECIRTD